MSDTGTPTDFGAVQHGSPPAAGSAAEEIASLVNGLATGLASHHDLLANPPSVADVLHNAGAALVAFGQGMAGAYRDSALRNAASDAVNGIATNIQNLGKAAGRAAGFGRGTASGRGVEVVEAGGIVTPGERPQ